MSIETKTEIEECEDCGKTSELWLAFTNEHLCRACHEDRKSEYDAVDAQVKALAKHLDCAVSEIDAAKYDTNLYDAPGRQQYLVLTDEEADERCRERILDSVWAFNADFIASHTSPRLNTAAQQALREVQGKLCEGANDLVLALLKDVDAFVDDAIRADGRGHFLAGYDGDESEVNIDGTTYYIYRQ